MAEIPKRLSPRLDTIRELCLKCGNLCAYPGCTELMMTDDGVLIGQLCHIEAAEPGGERFNPNMTNEERRSAANLMFMCYRHHTETNDVNRFTVVDLTRMKSDHEYKFSRPDRGMREVVAKMSRAALFAIGAGTGISLGGIVQQIRSALDVLVDPSNDVNPKTLRKELQHILQYAPTGTVYCYSRDPIHNAVGDVYLDIFERAGWRINRVHHEPLLPKEAGNFDRSMVIIFSATNEHQVPVVRQAVDAFFERCGFVPGASKDNTVRQGRYPITLLLPVGVVKLP